MLQTFLGREMHDLANQVLAGVVTGMRLARKDQLDGPRLAEQNRLQSFDLAEDQRGPLIRREATGEADGERVRGERLPGGIDLPARSVSPLRLSD